MTTATDRTDPDGTRRISDPARGIILVLSTPAKHGGSYFYLGMMLKCVDCGGFRKPIATQVGLN